MQKTIKRQRIFIAIILVINITISLLSYALQVKAVTIIEENKKLKEIIKIKEDLKE